MWANSNVPEGLASKAGVLLHTAVGMPICFAGDALCVIVLFATQPVPMTPGAIEFLCSTARAASAIQTSSGFIKSDHSPMISPTSSRANKFKDAWDVSERLSYTHSTSVHFHLLPVDRLQAFSDYQEVTSLHDIHNPNEDILDYTHSSTNPWPRCSRSMAWRCLACSCSVLVRGRLHCPSNCSCHRTHGEQASTC